MDDLIFHLGGAVKALPDSSVIEGLLIPFGGPEDLDADGEFFSAKTDLGLRMPAEVQLYYNHGLNESVGRTPLARAILSREADGVHFKADLAGELDEWLDGEREKAQKYQALTLKLAREGRLGASSGAAPHVVVKQAAAKGQWIARWPTVEASVTPHPASPRTFGTVSVKTLAALPGPEAALKCCGCGYQVGGYEENVPAEATMAALSRMNDALFYRTVSDALRDDKTPLAERVEMLRQAFDEHRDLALRVIGAILSGGGDEDAESAAKSIKSLWGATLTGARGETTLVRHSEAVVSANAEYAERLETRHDARVKSGRVLSAANAAEMGRVRASLAEVLAALDALLARAHPAETETKADRGDEARETERLRTELLRLQSRPLLAGVER